MNQELHDFLVLNGYEELRDIDGNVCGLMRMLYTVGVCHGLDRHSVRGRFCFDTWQNASLFLKEWDGCRLPTIGEDGCTAIKGEVFS